MQKKVNRTAGGRTMEEVYIVGIVSDAGVISNSKRGAAVDEMAQKKGWPPGGWLVAKGAPAVPIDKLMETPGVQVFLVG